MPRRGAGGARGAQARDRRPGAQTGKCHRGPRRRGARRPAARHAAPTRRYRRRGSRCVLAAAAARRGGARRIAHSAGDGRQGSGGLRAHLHARPPWATAEPRRREAPPRPAVRGGAARQRVSVRTASVRGATGANGSRPGGHRPPAGRAESASTPQPSPRCARRPSRRRCRERTGIAGMLDAGTLVGHQGHASPRLAGATAPPCRARRRPCGQSHAQGTARAALRGERHVRGVNFH